MDWSRESYLAINQELIAALYLQTVSDFACHPAHIKFPLQEFGKGIVIHLKVVFPLPRISSLSIHVFLIDFWNFTLSSHMTISHTSRYRLPYLIHLGIRVLSWTSFLMTPRMSTYDLPILGLIRTTRYLGLLLGWLGCFILPLGWGEYVL